MDIVYLETSIVSHATARRASDPMIVALQEQASQWMTQQRPLYDVVTSQLVIDEASLGHPEAAERRLRLLDGIPILPANPDAETIADEIVGRFMMPEKARVDALHVRPGSTFRRTISVDTKL